MKLPAGNGSLSGLQTLRALVSCTRDFAAERGFVNLVSAMTEAIENADRAPFLQPGDVDRTHSFSRLSSLQREALICFRDNRDITPPKDSP